MKKLFFFILIILFGFSKSVTVADNADFSGGNGTKESPWIITTATQLNKIRDNNGSVSGLTYFKLINDIDLRDISETNNWTPINTSGAFVEIDGNGHVIKNMHISTGSASSPNYQSFVGVLFGKIMNLGLTNVYINAPKIGSAGSFAGYVGAAFPADTPIKTGAIENSFASGYVSSGGGAVGGITGFIGRPADDGTPSYIRNCFFSGELYNSYTGNSSTVYTGGIAGGVKANENLRPSMPDTLTLVSYNVRVFINNTSYPNGNYQPIANILKSLSPDVVCMQELDSVTTRTNNVYQLDYLSGLTGWNYRYARSIPYRGGSYGLGITSPHNIIRSSSHKLTSGKEQRVFLIAEFPKYVMVSTHMDLDVNISKIQAQEITAKVRELYGNSPKPVFIAGDFNVLPNSATMQEFHKNWIQLSTYGYSFPANAPDRCIDYIMMLNKGREYEILDSRVISSSPHGNISVESDHLPIMVKVVVK